MIRILIPVYNEGKNIEKCIAGIVGVLGQEKYKIYAVNDGSKDNSKEILKKLSGKFSLKIENHEINRGVASAFKTGLSSISKEAKLEDILIVMEGDNTSDPKPLLLLIDKIRGGEDVAIASRYSAGGMYKGFPLKRLFFSKSANFIFRVLFPFQNVKDYTIFYRAYKWKIIEKAIKQLGDELITTKFFTANTELLVKLMSLTKKISEVPLVYDYGNKKGKSALNIKRNLWQYVRLIVEYKIGI